MPFIPDEAGIAEFLETTVRGYVADSAEKVADAARVNAAPRTPDSFGDLAESIHTEDIGYEDGFYYRVIADPVDDRNGFHYALVAHDGHGTIFPRADGPGELIFFWNRTGRVEHLPLVHATRGNPFMTDALREVNETLSDPFILEPGDE